ncbi:fungal-specific transcription factor domain-containing protein [Ilyonectria destructans]|nr:fungal-specific transcription factor domain-containing protein [Ilyonectria destructans]
MRATYRANTTRHLPPSDSSSQKKSCFTCRRRRVKCNKIRPICGPCDRLSLECLSTPPADKFVWLPINLIQAETVDMTNRPDDPGENVGDEKSLSEGPTQARRTAIFTERERKAMSQELLQAIECIEIDDLLQSLQRSTEVGIEAASAGPFAVFPTQTTEVPGTLSLSSPVISFAVSAASSSSSSDTSHLSKEANNASITNFLDISSGTGPSLSGQPPNPDDQHEIASPDHLNSILSVDWEEILSSEFNFDASPVCITPEPSLHTLHTQERLELGACSLGLPSPLSLNLPFLTTSQVLQRVPPDAFFLLEYYGSNVLFLLSPLPNRKPPWKRIHHPSVLETTAALLIDTPVKHAQLALFYSILSISSFHFDWHTTIKAQTESGIDRDSSTQSYWWKLGEEFQRIATIHLQISLRCEFSGSSKAKYKHILMTLLCMVTICVLTGRMNNGRRFLLDAERAIRLRGLKPNPSKKVQLLHNIFLYNRIIEDSTFIYPNIEQFKSPSVSGSSTQISFPANGVKDSVSSSCDNAPDDLNAVGTDRALFDQLISNDGAWFEKIYGLPIALMNLISQVTSLAHEADQQQSSLSGENLQIGASFDGRARTLEDLICGFKWQPYQKGPSEVRIGTESTGLWHTESLTMQGSTNVDMMRPFVSAMHHALLIFFYRRIRKLNRYVLQNFVKQTISELFTFQRVKDENNITTPVPCWPGFIAGCEAMEEEDRQRIRQWFKQSGCGWRSFAAIGEVLEQFWVANDLKGSARDAVSTVVEMTWEHFSRTHHLAIIST